MAVPQSAKAQASIFKKKGNNAYKNKQWKEAIEAYSKALEVMPPGDEEASVYFCNRAAAHLMLVSAAPFTLPSAWNGPTRAPSLPHTHTRTHAHTHAHRHPAQNSFTLPHPIPGSPLQNQHNKVVADCTEALKIQPTYVKVRAMPGTIREAGGIGGLAVLSACVPFCFTGPQPPSPSLRALAKAARGLVGLHRRHLH